MDAPSRAFRTRDFITMPDPPATRVHRTPTMQIHRILDDIHRRELRMPWSGAYVFEPFPETGVFEPFPDTGVFEPFPDTGVFEPSPDTGVFEPSPDTVVFEPSPAIAGFM